jgi:hypothetical protein
MCSNKKKNVVGEGELLNTDLGRDSKRKPNQPYIINVRLQIRADTRMLTFFPQIFSM